MKDNRQKQELINNRIEILLERYYKAKKRENYLSRYNRD